MKKYIIFTRDANGNQKKMFYKIDMTTPEFVHHVKTQLYGKCHGVTIICRVFANGKYGKQYII